MQRVAILGGGIAGLTAAYELEQQRKAGKLVQWQLFEASDRWGGTVATTRHQTAEGEYILEDGPDGWVTEKPWARELAEELGLGGEIIKCREAGKRTYIWQQGSLVPMPDRMRLMVPEDLTCLENSPLFSAGARRSYALELQSSDRLRAEAPSQDESVASFVRRHFGDEVLVKVAAPLLSGVFGGDVERLSVQAVMPTFVQMERESGSLIAALQRRAKARGVAHRPATFTSLRRGMGSLVDALIARLPSDHVHLHSAISGLERSTAGYKVNLTAQHNEVRGQQFFEHVIVATPLDVTRALLGPVDQTAASLIPTNASSAVLVTLCWPAAIARTMALPPGFGFLVPLGKEQGSRLLAGTFTDQKYPDRAPDGAHVIRAFFGGDSAEQLSETPDGDVVAMALAELQSVLEPLPEPHSSLTTVVRWPRSLPQYEVGHLERMEKLQTRIQALGNLDLLGNGYYGVGVPDLIRDARAAARKLVEKNNR